MEKTVVRDEGSEITSPLRPWEKQGSVNSFIPSSSTHCSSSWVAQKDGECSFQTVCKNSFPVTPFSSQFSSVPVWVISTGCSTYDEPALVCVTHRPSFLRVISTCSGMISSKSCRELPLSLWLAPGAAGESSPALGIPYPLPSSLTLMLAEQNYIERNCIYMLLW